MQAKARQENILLFHWFALYNGVAKSTESITPRLN